MAVKKGMSPTKISLVRHGAVDNPDQIYYGRLPDFELSEEGRVQAHRSAYCLRQLGVNKIFHSPLLRTTQTAEILANGVEPVIPARVDERLLEVYTPFDGRPLAELEAQGWNMYTGNQPPYEQPTDILQRVRRFIDQVLERYPGEHIAAVTHGDVIGFTILWVLNREISVENKGRFVEFGLPEPYPATGSITTLHFHGRELPAEVSLRYINPSLQDP